MDDIDKSNFVICVRNVVSRGSEFGSEPGKTCFLEVPNNTTPSPKLHKIRKKDFANKLIERATTGQTQRKSGNFATGDVLVFIHGYNNHPDTIMRRHDLLQRNLRKFKYKGVIVSFDWPCDDSALNYLEDRRDAKQTAFRLVDDGIKLIALLQKDQLSRKCEINVHLLGHSTGAYVIREGFADANQNLSISRINWTVSQIALIGADISARSLSSDNEKSRSLFQHAVRITNCSNRFDGVLKLSNTKRFGTSPRVGRVGIPEKAHSKCVNVDCSQYWETAAAGNKKLDNHSWHFDDQRFAEDLAHTISGDIDRHRIPTRKMEGSELTLN